MKPRRLPMSLGSQVALFVTAGAIVPLTLLLAVSSAFFQHAPTQALPFEYWAFLIVLWVLGTVFVVSRVFSRGLEEQLEPLRTAANDLTRGTQAEFDSEATEEVPGREQNELSALADRFNQIEIALADSRASALGRIRQLEEENERLRAITEQQGAFLSAVSHEIRSPLSAIVSAARIIKHYHEKKPEVVDRFGDTISSEGKRLSRLVGDLLDVARLEADGIEWQDDEVRPDRLVLRAAKQAEAGAAEHGLAISSSVSETLPTVWGDDRRLSQVLEKLLDNAIKFTPRGGSIWVSAAERDGTVRFTVRDTGPGITASEQEAIFDKAHMLASGTTRRDKKTGTGLGLAICRGIVQRHGGKIWVVSQGDNGTAFHFELPVIGSHHIAVAVPAPAEEAPRVVLLMKNETVADAAVRALRLQDIDSRVCSQLQDVFAILPDWQPDVVVVSSSCVWQLTEGVEHRLRKAGVSHILMLSPQEGLVEMSPPTHTEPLLTALGKAAPDGSTILLAEDDEEYSAVVEFELSQAGYDVVQAFTGPEAVEAVCDRRPDAMILDMVMPQLDGFGVLERLAEKGQELPAVVLTSLDDEALEERLLALGAVGVFRKHELLQPRSDGLVVRVKTILGPVVEANIAGETPDAACVA